MPMANGFLLKKDFRKEFFYNLKVGFNEKNYLFQVGNHPKSSQIFNDKYPFFTHKSKFMVNHFNNFFKWLQKNYLKKNDKIIEVGSNDGTFLLNFLKKKYNVLGFEPSLNVANIARKKGLKVISKFFNYKNISKNKKFKKKINLICAANVICHIPDLKNLIKSIDFSLCEDGLFIFEEPYLGSMFKKVSYDQIYDEHIYIFSLNAIDKICKDLGLNLFHCEHQTTHGGSMRYFISKNLSKKKTENLDSLYQVEIINRLNKIDTFYEFAENCEKSKKILIDKLTKLREEKIKVYGYGATSKSTTILNYCNINKELVNCICDITPEKQNKLSPGMHIPIYSEKFKEQFPPDQYLLFAWNHFDEILKKEKSFIKNGGKFFTHLYK